MDEEKVRRFFQNDYFAMDTGIKVDSVTPGNCVCSLRIEKRHLNSGGVVQGGVLFTLADFAFAVAANSEGQLTVSLHNAISFLHPAQGNILYASTKRISGTKRICFYEVFIEDDTGVQVAHMTVNGFRKGTILDFS